MGIRLNPFTGKFDIDNDSRTGSSFDIDTVLTDNQFDVLVDQDGNLIVGEE